MTVTFDGEDVAPLTPSQRGIGLVFQTYALYPHSGCAATSLLLPLRRWPARILMSKSRKRHALWYWFDQLLGVSRAVCQAGRNNAGPGALPRHSPRVCSSMSRFQPRCDLASATRGEVKRLVDRLV